MSFLKKLFGIQNDPTGGSLEEHMDYLNSLRQPSILLRPTDTPDFNKLGGEPHLPENYEWPYWKDRPLAFFCQVDLSTLAGLVDEPQFPHSGRLYFFDDPQQDATGTNPNDAGGWRVLYADSAAAIRPTPPPDGRGKTPTYNEIYVEPSVVQLFPNFEDERVESLPLTDMQWDTYCELNLKSTGAEYVHHFFGHAQPIQNAGMELDCQLVSNGISHGLLSDGYKSAEAKALAPGKSDWTLLLQLATDDDAGWMFGDGGVRYFWIKKDDLKEGRFENVWAIMQCF